MAVTVDPIREMLRADLAAFADPGEPLVVSEGDEWTAVEWLQNGRRSRGEFRLGQEPSFQDTTVRIDGRELSYRSFLSSAPMGDLRAVARNTAAVLDVEGPFVSPLGIASDGSSRPADELIEELAAPTEDKTSVVFLTADAGEGKTTLMKRAAVDRARSFLDGSGEQLWLYVDAQGSRLARLDQALAQALDEVRAPFPYHATAALVRVGALVLVIDGFDELIGTTGSYDEAYGSLSGFLESLAGSGSVVAVARSAYYEQEFVGRVNRTIGFAAESWELRPLRLLDWNVAQRRAFVEALAARSGQQGRAEELSDQLEATFADAQLRPLSGKPLFVSRVAGLLLAGESLAVGELAIDRLVNAYINREVRLKLTSPDGRPLVSEETFRAILQELADEMWREEARTLSRTTVRELMGLFADLYDLDEEASAVLLERLPYVAFLGVGHGEGTVAFEHELFFAYFLVQPLIQELSSESAFALSQTLSRGRLPREAALLAGREMRQLDPAVTLGRLSNASAKARSLVARQNAAAVALGVLEELTPAQELTLEHMDFVALNMRDLRLDEAVLRDTEFSGVDLRGARVERSYGEGVRLNEVVLDEETRLELEGVPLTAVTSVVTPTESGALATHYAPARIQEVLLRAGFPAAEVPPVLRAVREDVVRVLEQLMRSYGHTNVLVQEDPDVVRVTRHAFWPGLREALVSSGVLREERRPASGNKTFLRSRARPADVLAGQELGSDARPEVEALWDRLETDFPAD